ncbi:MAG: 1-phosphofructokinase [Lachnospiraceae bacterium]|nr:1-phosphofructokinase [Lachnospiraceae bacterium]
MVYTVTLNPSLDYIVDVDGFAIGQVNRTKGEKIYPGGKGLNVSMVLKELGVETKALGFTAGFTGEALEKLLRERGVESDFIQLGEGLTRINVKLRSGEETEINGQGPVVSERDIDKLCEKLKALGEGDCIVLAGSVPSGMPKTVYRDIIDKVSGQGLKVAVDTNGELLLSVLDTKPFLIKPNNHELSDIFGVEIKTKEDAAVFAKKLQERGAGNVLVSMAGEGAVLVTEAGEVIESGVPKGEVKNSVGAGDSMLAGFIAGYMESGDYARSLKMGICAGSASAFSELLATKKEIEELMKGDY